jgi:uncharacterized protein YndB with AHSA1/START domain
VDNDARGRIVNGDTLVYVREVPHSPERVWQAISDDAEIRTWMRYPVSFRPEVGTPVNFFDGELVGQVFIVDPPRTLAFSFWDAGKPEMVARVGEDWTVRWDLEPIAGGCRITFTHRWLNGTAMWGVSAGWHEFLAQLMAYLDGQLEALIERRETNPEGSYAALIGPYRTYVSGELKAWALEAATAAHAATGRGDMAGAASAIERLQLAVTQLYDIARHPGTEPDFSTEG